MFEPVRGGTRGGQAEFKWSDVSQDKDRENYLGHSINAPTGRWQKNKDIHWYQRDLDDSEEARKEELRKVKEAEAEALAAALRGFAPGAKPSGSDGAGTGANAIAVPVKASSLDDLDPEKEERPLRKAQKKEEKRLKKEQRQKDRGDAASEDRRHRRSRSRSPLRRDQRRSASPRRRDRSAGPGERAERARTPPRRRAEGRDYDEEARNREREMARRRWDGNASRDRPSGSRWGRC
ncbi:kinase phosphorylation protein-domain-containing protein [Epithele typhae]|uniref:kinase phosphorylation protein-domain-containing protein n=1 Tax=Epithele typhae TaxID=378194 RepID=UPI002007282B|nr:kinase phosphorylation protein-domain-containing protein [Epithele typhae]KAH9940380.1 kinase phosphorylation protein-domain-containing protein [Epithele typhae]